MHEQGMNSCISRMIRQVQQVVIFYSMDLRMAEFEADLLVWVTSIIHSLKHSNVYLMKQDVFHKDWVIKSNCSLRDHQTGTRRGIL